MIQVLLLGRQMFTDRAKVRETRKQREKFATIRKAEIDYARNLRRVARHVSDVVRTMATPADVGRIAGTLRQYASSIEPWARATGARMLADVQRRDTRAWASVAEHMGTALRTEIEQADLGSALRIFLDEQVHLITSLPIEAAQKVHELVQTQISSGARFAGIVDEIMGLGSITIGRANLIARTESARVASAITQIRAQAIGSDGYVWRTARDRDVRRSHAAMEGKFVKWSKPPTLIDGTTTHAGQIFSCRCYPEPVIPDRFAA